MRAKIDDAGRVKLPEDVCSRAGIGPGSEVEIGCRDGEIIISPRRTSAGRETGVASEAVAEYGHLERRDGLLVAVAGPGAPALTLADIEATRREVFSERMGIEIADT